MEDNVNNSVRTNGARRLLAATVVVLAAPSTVPAAAAGQSAPGRQASARHTKHGVEAPVIDQGATSHNETYLRSGPQIVRWFDAAARR
ncbi:hypothetical protein [Streptomyces brevispora]|uniref:Uncharacterized protein n=1 Tax=Streptomyces brevispora TaxID=887462 RepID=A0ABZ1GA05_9ACTN|nr:hypothetical protein [Streptomyces brevispora]WSC16081.1 hypothetical protein OIE64_26800 [Streptomyces brevispora]